MASVAHTGLETVANLSEEVRRPGRDLPRSVFSAIGARRRALRRDRRRWASLPSPPAHHSAREYLGEGADDGHRRPPEGSLADVNRSSAAGLRGPVGSPDPADGGGYVGSWLRPACLLARRARTAAARLRAPQPPVDHRAAVDHRPAAGDLDRSWSWATTALRASVFFLAGLYSFGVLLAFTAAQIAVVKLRFSHPERAPALPGGR